MVHGGLNHGGLLSMSPFDDYATMPGDGLLQDAILPGFSWAPAVEHSHHTHTMNTAPLPVASHFAASHHALAIHHAAGAVQALAATIAQDDGACDEMPILAVPEPWILHDDGGILDVNVLCGNDEHDASSPATSEEAYSEDDTDSDRHFALAEGSRLGGRPSTSTDSDAGSYSSSRTSKSHGSPKSRARRPVSDLTVEIPAQCRGDGELGWSRYLLELPTVDLNKWLKTAGLPLQASSALKALRRRIKNRRYTQVARIRKGSSSPRGSNTGGGGGGGDGREDIVTPRRTKKTAGKR